MESGKPSPKKPLQVGDAVRVEAKDGHESLNAIVKRVHSNGEYAVEYSGSHEVESHVSATRITVQSSGKAATAVTWKEGDAVRYYESGKDKEDITWRDGVVDRCRKDGTLDIVDAATEEVVKKVAPEHVQARTKKKRSS